MSRRTPMLHGPDDGPDQAECRRCRGSLDGGRMTREILDRTRTQDGRAALRKRRLAFCCDQCAANYQMAREG